MLNYLKVVSPGTHRTSIYSALLIGLLTNQTVYAADYIYNGSGGPYTLSSGDTLTINSGTFNQFLMLPSGSTVNVEEGAIFKPIGFNEGAGTLNVSNGGVVELPAVTFNEGMVIDNSGDFTFTGGVDMNGIINITNRAQTAGYATPVMRFSYGYQLYADSVVDNQGLMTFQDYFNTDTGTVLTNSGTMTMSYFNPNGEVINNGFIRTSGEININYDAKLTNNCTFVADQGFINNGFGSRNNGIIITTTPTSNININRPFHQDKDGYMQGAGTGVDQGFTNNSIVTGGGNYYFIGQTKNNASFGIDFDGNDINFYDSVIDDTSKYFDVQNFGPINTNKDPITPITAAQAMANCTYAAIMAPPETPDPEPERLPSLDYGDAPMSGLPPNGVGVANYGEAIHVITPGLYLGSVAPDADLANQPDANSLGDDENGSVPDDEDAVVIPIIKRGESLNLSVTVNGAEGYLHAWIDWNGDGDFADIGEQIARNLQDDGSLNDIASGDNVINVSITVPSNAYISDTHARFRWTTSMDLDAYGPAPDGEVEDHILTILDAESSAACVMDDIDTRQYSSASPAANSRFLTEKTYVYEATFDTKDWSGRILAYNLTTEQGKGGVKSVIWDSTDTVTAGNRSLFTYNPFAESVYGTELVWENLNDQQKSWFSRSDGEAYGQARVKWLQGTLETTLPGSALRSRESLMGDIIHSSLTLRDPMTNYGYKSLPGTEGTEYAGFLNSKLTSSPSLLVGTNDGMFHALDPMTGKEFFSYIPNEVIKQLPDISHPLYGCGDDNCLRHEYTVDGTSTLGDAYLSSGWRSIVVGTLGMGGRGLFALDVTNPKAFSETDVLWEISSNQAPSDAAIYAKHLGYTQPAVSVVRIKNGQWVAVVSNGYESESNQAVLFVIDVETGELIKSFNTLAGSESSPNGMSTPTVIDTDGDSIADRIYAGDMMGNVWAIDISSKDPDAWGFAYGSTTAPQSFFQACSDETCNSPQPITAPPQVGQNIKSGLMVYVGTGKYFDVSDSKIDSDESSLDSFYGLQDDGLVIKRSRLVKQEILAEVDVSEGLRSRITSDNKVDYNTHKGWYLDLLTPPAANNDGERVIAKAILRGGRIIFTTLAPSVESCQLGGKSWLMEMSAQDGSRLTTVAFDVNDDLSFTEADNSLYEGSPTIISGLQKESLGLVRSGPVIVRHTTRSEGKYVSGSETGVGMFRESASQFSGRMSWTNISH